MSSQTAADPPTTHTQAGPRAYHWALGLMLAVLLLVGIMTAIPEIAIYARAFPLALLIAIPFWVLFTVLLWWLLGLVPFFAKMPRWAKWVSFLWGALIAITAAAALEGPPGTLMTLTSATGAQWAGAVGAPIIEETSKALGVVVVFLFVRRPITLVDGFATGAMVGLGFQVAEDLNYSTSDAWTAGGDNLRAIVPTLLERGVTGITSHWMLTGVFGVGIAYCFLERSKGWGRRVGVLVGLGAAAVAMHFLWDSPGPESNAASSVVVVLKSLLYLAIGLLVMRWARDDEGRFYTAYLVGVDPAVVTEPERSRLARGRTRFAARRAARAGGGRAAVVTEAKLQRAQARLAVARAHADSGAAQEAEQEVEGLRT